MRQEIGSYFLASNSTPIFKIRTVRGMCESSHSYIKPFICPQKPYCFPVMIQRDRLDLFDHSIWSQSSTD